MPPTPDWKRALETGMNFTEVRREQAQRIASDLVSQGQLARDQLGAAVDEIVETSRRASEEFRAAVAAEVRRQLRRPRDRGQGGRQRPDAEGREEGAGCEEAPAKKPAAKKPAAKKATAKKAREEAGRQEGDGQEDRQEDAAAKQATAKKPAAKKAAKKAGPAAQRAG